MTEAGVKYGRQLGRQLFGHFCSMRQANSGQVGSGRVSNLYSDAFNFRTPFCSAYKATPEKVHAVNIL